ncbi:diguanylate cyclase [Halomonas sp. DQ26W]|uniref:GGDEF domain-containing protein n=1 Tax=Halomonas sp. DQ26W TaxID=2282311 RepID=UPI000DF74E8F|nr:GGDEF domain-containing protein [Halomonas sp. DQ26W]RDB42500.1 diguanylate cyclase [Halomonas sp. DQ26W]
MTASTPIRQRRPRRSSLTAKQAVLTLCIALLLSIIAGAFELALDARKMRHEVQNQTQHRLDLVHGTAAEAAFQLNPELATQVVEGLFSGGRVAHVVIRDDFGRSMALRERNVPPDSNWLAHALFGDILHYQEMLVYDLGAASPTQSVGDIEMTLAIDSLARDFMDRSLLIFSLGVFKALAIAALLVVVFHAFITRPLLKVHAAIIDTNPSQPGRWRKPDLSHHVDDELGHLVESLDELLHAFQRGLDQRDQLHQISTIDGLTGIANRRQFDSFLTDSWQRARRSGKPLSVIFIDIDRFKDFNDHYGHVAGDDTLRAIAGALAGVVTRSTDLVARYGGEEFVCVLPDTDLAGARKVAHLIRNAIRALAISHAYSDHADKVTASLGVASAVPASSALTCEQLIEQADSQLYRAKQQGRNRVAWEV